MSLACLSFITIILRPTFMIAFLFMHRQPEMIGNNYLVIGTLDKADWRRSMKQPFNFAEMRACLHDFKKVMSFEPMRYTWVKDDSK